MALQFNSTYYYQQRADVLAAWVNSDQSLSPYAFALAHYNEFGWKEGSNPNAVFNSAEYLAANTDVADAGINPLDHFNQFGMAEGRAPSASTPGLNDFNWEVYLASNSDLTEAGITTQEAAYDHFINFGHSEGRDGTPAALSFTLADALAAAELPVGYTISDATLTGEYSLADLAAAEAILAGADNATVPELDGDYTVADTADNIIAAESLPVEVADIRITDDNLTIAQRDALVDLGFDAADLPGLNDADALEEALANLVAAQGDMDGAQEVAALLENGRTGAHTTPAAIESFVAGYDANDVALELANAQNLVASAQVTLAAARGATTDAALATAHANALAVVLADDTPGGALELYNAREAANSALAAHVAANGSNLEALTALRDGLVAAVAAGLPGATTNVDAAPVTVADLIDTLNAEIAAPTAATSATLINTIAGYDALGNLDNTAAEDAVAVIEDRDDLATDAATAENDLNLDTFGGTLVTAEGNLAARESLIDDVADAQAYLAEYQAAADAFTAAETALAAATAAVEDLGYNPPVDLISGTLAAGADGDIFIYNDPADTDTPPVLVSNVTGFGVDGDDLIFFNEDFVRVDMAAGASFTAGGQGNAGVLEIFVQQVGVNTVLYVEDDTFDGSVSGAWGGNTITLVGVDASSLDFSNGILRIADTVA